MALDRKEPYGPQDHIETHIHVLIYNHGQIPLAVQGKPWVTAGRKATGLHFLSNFLGPFEAGACRAVSDDEPPTSESLQWSNLCPPRRAFCVAC